jgi:hypothetical protein
LLSIALFTPLVFAEQGDAASAIDSAKQQIITCYEAAKEAEGAGANVTSLTSTLNEAGLFLSQAELAYSKNDFGAARNLAVQSRESLSNFIAEANTLKETGAQQRTNDFLENVVGSIIGAFAVIGTGIGVWFFLRKRYEQPGGQENEPERV